jgi:hypothetical protein
MKICEEKQKAMTTQQGLGSNGKGKGITPLELFKENFLTVLGLSSGSCIC